MPTPPLSSTAIHEAGHAVVCIVRGGRFRYATLRPRNKPDAVPARGLVKYTGGLNRFDADSMSLAGVVAEFHAGPSVYDPDGVLCPDAPMDETVDFLLSLQAEGDCAAISEGRDGASMRQVMDLLLPATYASVNLYWSQVLAVAAALEANRTVSFREAERLVWGEGVEAGQLAG